MSVCLTCSTCDARGPEGNTDPHALHLCFEVGWKQSDDGDHVFCVRCQCVAQHLVQNLSDLRAIAVGFGSKAVEIGSKPEQNLVDLGDFLQLLRSFSCN